MTGKEKYHKRIWVKWVLGGKPPPIYQTAVLGQPPCQVLHFIASLGLPRKGLSQWGNEASKMQRGKHPCAPPPMSPASTLVLFQLLAPDCTSLTWTHLLRTVLKYLQPLSALQALARHLLDSSIPSNHAVLTSGLIICHPQLHPSSLSLRSLAMTQLAASFLLWFLELATQGSAIFSLSRMGRLGDGPAALYSALLRLCCCCCCLASSLHSWILFVLLVGVIFVLHLNQNVARSEVILSSCLKWVRYWSTGPRSFHVWMDCDQHPKASTVATRTGTLLGLVLRNYSIK